MVRFASLRLFFAVLLMPLMAPGPAETLAAPSDGVGNQHRGLYQFSNTVFIYLTDQSGNPLAGGCYNVTDYDSIEGVERTRQVCDGDDGFLDGEASISDLFDGEIDIVQTFVPEGCSEPDSTTVFVAGDSVEDVFLDNFCPPAFGTVEIVLVEQGGNRLPGGCFLVYFPEASYSPKPDVCDGNDGSFDGVAAFDVPAGVVGVHQTGTPAGCAPAEDVTTEVFEGKTATVTMSNVCASSRGNLDIRLMDPAGNLLGSGCFLISDAAGATVDNDCDNGDGVAHFTGLPEGHVVVEQTVAPAGYRCCARGEADIVAGQTSFLDLVNEPVALPTVTPTPTPRIEGLLLNEVLFRPQAGEPQFVELKNAGRSDVNLDGVSLLTRKGKRYLIPKGLPPLAPGEVLLVVFDGQDRVEGKTVHAAITRFMAERADIVYLRDPADRRLDRVAWGELQPDSVNLSRGGFVAPLEPGTTIGRIPSSTQPSDRFEWVTFAPAQSSPGAGNPVPGVEVLLPLDGSIFDGPTVHLTWYVVPGAATYHLEVASDRSFTRLVESADVTAPPYPVGPLAQGRYFWRVQAVAVDGSRASFSPAASFEIRAPGSARLMVDRPQESETASTRHSLDVPLIEQHKDSPLLLVDSTRPSPHAWDEVHPGLDPQDPADEMNCGLAAAAMVNAYFGGTMSQDEIGFHLFHDRRDGPMEDLNYGYGVYPDEVTDALRFALKLGKRDVVQEDDPVLEDFWEGIVSDINAGRPIVAAILAAHIVVIVGYEAGATRLVGFNDPYAIANGTTWRPLDAFPVSNYWRLRQRPDPAAHDARIGADSDQDGVSDFDEEVRFDTDPTKRDSRGDGVGDKRVICDRWVDRPICQDVG